MVYGFSWSFLPTNFRVSLDAGTPVNLASNSTLPDTVPNRIYPNGLLFFQGNLSDTSHTLTVDNDDGSGFLGSDYIEIVSITGGSP